MYEKNAKIIYSTHLWIVAHQGHVKIERSTYHKVDSNVNFLTLSILLSIFVNKSNPKT